MAIFSHPGGGRRGFYPHSIQNSLMCSFDDETGLSRTVTAPTNQKIWTHSVWMKRGRFDTGTIGYGLYAFDGTYYDGWRFEVGGGINWFTWNSGPGYTMQRYSDPIYRDPSAWYHIMVAYDNTQATAADRAKMYVNGVEPEYFSEVNPDQNETNTVINKSGETLRLCQDQNGNYDFDGLRAEDHFVDGQALVPADFGEFKNGIWIPKQYTGSHGNNGFHLDYQDSANLGNDVSGEANDLTENNITAANQFTDTPTNNFPTINPLDMYQDVTVHFGNLNWKETTPGTWYSAGCTMPIPTTGKWYWECTVGTDLAYFMIGFGVPNILEFITTVQYIGGALGNSWAFYCNGAPGAETYRKFYNNSGVTLTGATPVTGDIMQVAIDMDAGKCWFGVDNSWLDSADPAAGTGEHYSGIANDLIPMVSINSNSDDDKMLNFGQVDFAYTPPAGFKAICSANMPEPEFLEGNVGFDVVTYEGTGAEKAITDLEFSPGLVWTKDRDNVTSHIWQDIVRGAYFYIRSDSNAAGGADMQTVKSFDSNGYTLGTSALVNRNAASFVGFSFNEAPEFGFDIIQYEGTGVAKAVSHNGLLVVPELIIVKDIDTIRDWAVYHKGLNGGVDPEDYYLVLNSTAAEANLNTVWNDTAPTSSTFTVGTSTSTNANGFTYMAYLFASIPGFSKVFSFPGNNDINGTFIHCGFRPRYVMLKESSAIGGWILVDSARSPYNVVDEWLYAGLNSVEQTGLDVLDIYSNGFKMRYARPVSTWIGIAFAEHPFKYSNAR